jgi:hypothetical protein
LTLLNRANALGDLTNLRGQIAARRQTIVQLEARLNQPVASAEEQRLPDDLLKLREESIRREIALDKQRLTERTLQTKQAVAQDLLSEQEARRDAAQDEILTATDTIEKLQELRAAYRRRQEQAEKDGALQRGLQLEESIRKIDDEIAQIQSERRQTATNEEIAAATEQAQARKQAAEANAQLELQLAEATNQQLLAREIQIRQQIAELRKQRGDDQTVGPDALSRLEAILIAQARFEAQITQTRAALEFYQRQIELTNQGLAAGTINTQDGLAQLASYRAAIQQLGEQALPQLQAIRQAMAAMGTDISGMDQALLDLQRAINQGGLMTFAEQARLTNDSLAGFNLGLRESINGIQTWGQVGYNAAQQLTDGIANGAAQAFDAFITGTQNAGDVFRNFVADTLRGIAQMIVQTLVLRAIQAGLRAVGGFADGGLIQGYAAGGPVQGFPTGGLVRGPGGPRDDMIPAMLSNGEYVIPAHRVQEIGLDRLEAIRHGQMNFPVRVPSTGNYQAFGDGGLAGTAPAAAGAAQPMVIQNTVVVDDRARRELFASAELEDRVLALINTHNRRVARAAQNADGFNG